MILLGHSQPPQLQLPQPALAPGMQAERQRRQGMQKSIALQPDLDILIRYECNHVPQHVVVGGRAVGQQVPQGLQTLACKADGVLGIPAGQAVSASSQLLAKLGLASLQQATHAQGNKLQLCGSSFVPAHVDLCLAEGPASLALGPAGQVQPCQWPDTQFRTLPLECCKAQQQPASGAWQLSLIMVKSTGDPAGEVATWVADSPF